MLSHCKCNKDVDRIKVGIDFKKQVLNFVVNDFHAIMSVNSLFIVDIDKNEESKDKEKE